MKSEWERARNSRSALESAEQLLDRLRLKLDAMGAGELSWETRRRIVEELVAGIEVESLFDPSAPRGKQRTAVITYRFEAPDANRKVRGGRNNGTATAATMSEELSAAALSLSTTHLHSCGARCKANRQLAFP